MKKSIYTVDQIDALLSGKGLSLSGPYTTVNNVPNPVEGVAYLIGTAAPYDVCVYVGDSWVNAGPFQGPVGPSGPPGPSGSGTGDMVASVYDPDGKRRDIFAYVDVTVKAAVDTAIGEVLRGSY